MYMYVYIYIYIYFVKTSKHIYLYIYTYVALGREGGVAEGGGDGGDPADVLTHPTI